MTNTENNKDEKETTNVPNETASRPNVQKGGETDVLSKRLDEIENGLKVELEESREESRLLREQLKNSNSNEIQDDIVDTKRKSAHIMNLPIIEGAPVVKSKITGVIGVKGLEMIAKVENANGEEFEVPFGCDVRLLDFSLDSTKDLYKTAYENLKSEKFELVDIDENDLTGASKVEKGQLVSEGSLIPEVDRSTGVPRATGRKIRTKVTKDLRHYTIKFGSKKFTLTNEDLANIRI